MIGVNIHITTRNEASTLFRPDISDPSKGSNDKSFFKKSFLTSSYLNLTVGKLTNLQSFSSNIFQQMSHKFHLCRVRYLLKRLKPITLFQEEKAAKVFLME